MSKSSLFYLTIVGSGLLIGTGLFFINQEKTVENTSQPSSLSSPVLPLPELSPQEFTEAQAYLQKNQPEKALALITKNKEIIETLSSKNDPEAEKWVELFIQTSEALHDAPQLSLLYESFPHLFQNKEKSALIIAAYSLQNEKIDSYKALRSSWKNRGEGNGEEWLMLDSDQLLLEEKYSEAIDLLLSATPADASLDSRRLLRLSILHAADHPEKAAFYADKALEKDPKNVDLHLYRATLLERERKFNEVAQEYHTALEISPDNEFLKDQFAEFHLRQGNYKMALEMWQTSLPKNSPDALLAKMLFWKRMVHSPQTQPQGSLSEASSSHIYTQYLETLDAETFWNAEIFNQIPHAQELLFSNQSTFWLRLLDDLKKGNELEALTLLDENVFYPISWNPALENSLKRILAYRLTGEFESVNDLPTFEEDSLAPSFFKELEQIATLKQPLNEEMQALLQSPEIFAVSFLTAGWTEAGLHLTPLFVTLPSQFPDWVAIRMTQALRTQRSDQEALSFALLQSPSPALSLLTGELLFATGQPEAGEDKLASLLTQPSEAGYQAALILSKNHFKERQYQKVKEILSKQPLLAESLVGKEMRARIALQEDDKPLATTLYTSIAALSNEAKSYLARQAFEDKNWPVARSLTEELLERYPTNARLKENLERIKQEQIQAEPS